MPDDSSKKERLSEAPSSMGGVHVGGGAWQQELDTAQELRQMNVGTQLTFFLFSPEPSPGISFPTLMNLV